MLNRSFQMTDTRSKIRENYVSPKETKLRRAANAVGKAITGFFGKLFGKRDHDSKVALPGFRLLTPAYELPHAGSTHRANRRRKALRKAAGRARMIRMQYDHS